MATVIQQDNAGLLRNTLKVNALASGATGLMSTFGAGVVAPFMGIDSSLILVVLGIGLVVFAAGVFASAVETPLSARKGQIIFVLDIVWVVGSVLLLIADPLTFTNEGKWVVLLLADVVGVFAIGEFLGLRRMR